MTTPLAQLERGTPSSGATSALLAMARALLPQCDDLYWTPALSKIWNRELPFSAVVTGAGGVAQRRQLAAGNGVGEAEVIAPE